MPGSLRTEAIVLRSIRYGEADRILHLYTPEHGRMSAIAKGARRTRSRFGARLEPFFHLRTLLYQGRSDLLTVTSAETLDAHGPLRERAASLDAAARACDAVARLFETGDPSPPVFHLLANELRLLDDDERASGAAHQLAFRLKLLVAGGFTPQLATCASCGEADHLSGFSGAAGGVVCSACEASAFPLCAGGACVPRRGARPPARGVSRRRPARAAPGRAGDHGDGRAPRARAPAAACRARPDRPRAWNGCSIGGAS